MKDTLHVGAAQMGPADAEKGLMVERMLALLRQAGAAGVEVLCFPELALTPYFPALLCHDVSEFCETDFPPSVAEPLYRVARALPLGVILPYAEKTGDRVFNSAAIIGPEGEALGKYRKMHIPGWVEPKPDGWNCLEKRYFTPGDLGFPVYRMAGATVGLQICHDRRFPEAARSIALGGAQVIFTTYVTPISIQRTSDINPSELCLRASAHSNNGYVVCVGKAGGANATRML